MTAPTILEFADTLAAAPGIDPPTPRWAATLAYLYGLQVTDAQLAVLTVATRRSPDAILRHIRAAAGRRLFRSLWARIGRRGRKSATAALIAIYEALYGGHEAHVLPREQALVAIISKDLAGANVVGRFVQLYLDALSIKFRKTRLGAVDIIEIDGCQIGVAMLAATSEAPRGYALPVIILDEYAHHATGDEYENTDSSILDAAIAAQMQFPNPLLIGISTPLAKLGKFHENVESALGNDNDDRSLAVHGSTWDWNPDISEATVRAELKDPRVLAREGLALPQAARLSAFPDELIDRSFVPRVPALDVQEQVLVLDPSSGGLVSRDRFTWARVAWRRDEFPSWGYLRDSNGNIMYRFDEPIRRHEFINWKERGTPYLNVLEVGGIDGGFSGTVSGDEIVDHLVKIARKHKIRVVHSDQRESLFLESALSKRGLRFHSHTWSAQSKAAAVTLVRRWLADNTLVLPPEAKELRSELLQFEEVVTQSGMLTFGARGRGHDDFVALLITLAHAEMDPKTRLQRSSLGREHKYGMANW